MRYEIPHRNRHCAPRGKNRIREPHPGPRFLFRGTHRRDGSHEARFRIVTNPTGILFNPLSIAAALRSYADEAPVQHSELDFDGELWFHYGFHGSLSAASPDEALAAMNAARKAGAEALRRADRVLLTLGTAWVYEHNGQVVANCHRQPATEFVRRRLGVAEITGAFSALLAGPLGGKEVILTVSPVRHLGDGLEGNAVSKAALRLAAEELAGRTRRPLFPGIRSAQRRPARLPVLRRRSGASAPQAVEYVWEKFSPRFSRSRPDVCCPTSAISSWPRRTGPATRRAQPTASSAAAGSKRSRRCRRSIFGPKRNISADVSK